MSDSASAPSLTTSRTPRAPLGPLAALVGVSLLLGGGHVFARHAFLHGVPVLTASSVRMLLTALLLALLLAARRESTAVGWARFAWTVPIGLTIAIQNVAIQTSVALMPVGIAILVFYTFPLFTGIGSTALGEVRGVGRLAATLAIALGGLALVLGVGDARPNVLGVILALAAAVAFTATLLMTPRLGAGLSAPVRTFFTMITAGVVLVALALARGELVMPESAAAWIGLAGLSICYALGIITLFLILPRLGAVQVAVVMNLEPVAVALLAWATLGEALAASQLAGALAVVGAVIYYQASISRKQ